MILGRYLVFGYLDPKGMSHSARCFGRQDVGRAV